MKLGLFLVVLSLVIPNAAQSQQAALPVFPGAAGFGTTTPAGSGRHLSPPQTTVVKVTTLADSGVGSLRDCAKRAGARICVFEVSGRIQLKTELLIDKPYITIAGQTAPSPGILITGSGIRVAANDVLIQHLQVRVGDATTGPAPDKRDGITIAGKSATVAKNVVLDHLSISWAIDENLGIWYPTTSDVTISNSIISEALYKSIHPKGPHSMGVLIGDGIKRVSMHRNILAHNYDRNPRMKPGIQFEFISNVVYNWGGSSSWNQANFSDTENLKLATHVAFIGNYYKRGPSSPTGASVYAKPPAAGSKIYVLSNLGPTRTNESLSEWKISSVSESLYRSLSPSFALSGVLPSEAIESYQQVLASAGARPKDSNPVDRRVVSEIALGTGTIRDCVANCARSAGGYPTMSNNQRAFVVPANPNADSDGDGYTDLEELLHAMAVELE